MSIDERNLAARARGRDCEVFEELVHACRSGLVHFCRDAFGLSDEDAQDAVQEACLRAWRGIGSFRGDARFGMWLHAIATNVCLDLVQRNRRLLFVDPSAAKWGPSGDAAGAVSSAAAGIVSGLTLPQAVELVNRVATGLRDPDASICRLRFVAELTSEEIGRLLGMTAVNVRTRLCRRIRPALLAEARRMRE